MGIDPLTHRPLPPPTEKSQEQENQYTFQNKQIDKKIDEMQAPILEVLYNGFCTDEVPLIEPQEILVSNSSAPCSSSSTSTTTTSNINFNSLLEDLDFLQTSDWLNGDGSTTNNMGFWDMDDAFSSLDSLINDIDYDRIFNPPPAHDLNHFSRMLLGEEC